MIEQSDKAVINLVNAIIAGGESEHGFIPEPLKDTELLPRVEAIKDLLVKFKMLAVTPVERS